MEMDQCIAKSLLNNGAVLIITGVPIRTLFGIDLSTYAIADNFRGVKMIPPGFHYVWCAATGPYGDSAPRVGFAHYFKAREILVKEWDTSREELRERQIVDPQLEKQRIREHLKDLDRFLAPYDLHSLKDWVKLTSTISEEVLNKCNPSLGTIRTNVELESCPDSERPRGSLNESYSIMKLKFVNDENDLLPKLKPVDGTAPRFSTVPDRVPKNCLPPDISRHSIDCIEACDELLKSYANSLDLIQEIQLSFAFFIIGFSTESLLFWRKILNLLSHSEEATGKYRSIYGEYCKVLVFQLPHLPEELSLPTERNPVYKDVRSLLYNLKRGELENSANLLIKSLEKSINWKFDSLIEDPEDMPVVVELNETIE
uniref:Protein AAR2 homolog n=1 Tax=Glossina brevipalpis TaxID=37001 RepID=A0A1A9W9Q2_9MUSC